MSRVLTSTTQPIKNLLRRVLSKKQYESLANLRRQLLGQQKNGLEEVQRLLQRHPLDDGALVTLKNSINVTGKMDYGRHDIFLCIDSRTEYDTRLRSCEKEPDTVKWIEDFMRPGDVFYDIGANVGVYSLVAAKYFVGAVKVFAFEPAFLNFTQLCRNIYLNNSQQTIFPLSVALSNKTGIGEFNYHDLVTGGSLHTLGAPIDHKGAPFTPVFIQKTLSYRLDDLIEQFKIHDPSHIKIDVDGIEKAVLEGAANTLLNSRLRSVIVELEEGDGKREITELLVSKGFQLHSEYRRWTPGMLNCIFIR